MSVDCSYDVPHQLDEEIRELAHHAPEPAALTAEVKENLITRIKQLLVEQDAVLIAHYYVDEELQLLAEQTGGCVADSLEMANFGNRHPATTLVVVGVRFMGETAKILNPEKRVLMPELEALCSLDLGCPVEEFSVFCDAHPDRTVVVYANTSAEVKARADWMVTSGNAIQVVNYLKGRGEKILWAPDRHLGHYIQQHTGADMLLWQGSCVVHDEFKAEALQVLKQQYPDAEVLVHPESPAEVVALADVVGSTSQIIAAAKQSKAAELIVATDKGLFHKIRQLVPGKKLLVAPTGGNGGSCTMCAHCTWMAMNGLQSLANVLATGENEVSVAPATGTQALVAIQRMLDFSREQGMVEKKIA